jgi:hypothetical protein
MLVIDSRLFIFKVKEVHFADYPHDVEGCHVAKFPLCKNKADVAGYTGGEVPTLVIDLTQDLDTIWRKMDNESCRNRIRRAQRDGIKININEEYKQFYQINESFERRKGFAPLFGIGTAPPETMKRYGTLFTAEYEGEILGGCLYLEDEDNIKLWLSASKRLEADREKAKVIGRANRLLPWEAIKYAKEKGLKEFDWGELWPAEEADKDEQKKAINSFKLSFGGEVVTRYSYEKVYSKSYRLAQKLYRPASYWSIRDKKQINSAGGNRS